MRRSPVAGKRNEAHCALPKIRARCRHRGFALGASLRGKNVKTKRLIAVLVIVCFTSCATIVHNDKEPISVTTDPSGADATVRCGTTTNHGVTPTTLLISRRAEGCVVEVSREGYLPRTVYLDRGYNASFWSNFAPASGVPAGLASAFGGFSGAGALVAIGVVGALGFAVDRFTGRGFGHHPDRLAITLEREQ